MIADRYGKYSSISMFVICTLCQEQKYMTEPQSKTRGNRYCPHCHATLPLWAKFCGSCGKKIGNSKKGKRVIRNGNVDNMEKQEDNTINVTPLAQMHLRRWQSFQIVETRKIQERPHLFDSHSQEIKASEQKVPSTKDDEAGHVEVQSEVLISTEAAEYVSSGSNSTQTWQRIPETEVPSLLRATTQLPSISYIPIEDIASNPSLTAFLWPIIIIISAFAAYFVNVVFTNTVVRPAIIFWFLCVCPGMVLIRFLRLKEPGMEWILGLTMSFTVDTMIAAIQLYTGRWSPVSTLDILTGFCLVVSTLQLAMLISQVSITGYSVIKAMERADVLQTKAQTALQSLRQLDLLDIILLIFPLFAIFLWSISLQTVSLNVMNDLGLISALSPKIITALGILVVSFAITLQRNNLRVSSIVFQLICIILILYVTPNLIEETVRFAPIYRSAGYTDYIMQTGTVAPQLDFYFNIPGFYVLSALFTKVSGYTTILSYAGWAPLFLNLIYAVPIYMIFTSITTNKRLVWLSLLFFSLTNWVGQDSFSPQGLNFFLYLVVITILLYWFRMPAQKQIQLKKSSSIKQKFFSWLQASDTWSPSIEPWQRRGLLVCLILFFGLMVFSHPLTPLFTLLSVFALVIFRRCSPFWLPILFLTMTVLWDVLMAGPYIFQHFNLLSSLGDLTGNVPRSITTGKLSGDALYHIISTMRLYMTLLLWLLAFSGGIKCLRQGNRDITYVLLAIAGFPLIAVQGYGNEMLMRIYLFTEPFMCFFAASLFLDRSMDVVHTYTYTRTRLLPWRTISIVIANILLLSSFFFTRYGDERVDYISSGEWNAVQYLYQIAPTNSLILAAWDYCPLYFKDYAKYNIRFLDSDYSEAVTSANANEIIDEINYQNQRSPLHSYIIISQEEQIYATSYNGLPGNTLQRLELSLLQSKKFKLVYYNTDAQILQFTGVIGKGT